MRNDLKLGAFVFVLKVWRHYQYRVKFDVFTNHKSLNYLHTVRPKPKIKKMTRVYLIL